MCSKKSHPIRHGLSIALIVAFVFQMSFGAVVAQQASGPSRRSPQACRARADSRPGRPSRSRS